MVAIEVVDPLKEPEPKAVENPIALKVFGVRVTGEFPTKEIVEESLKAKPKDISLAI